MLFSNFNPLRGIAIVSTLLFTAIVSFAYDFVSNGIYYKIDGNIAVVASGDSKYSGNVDIPTAVSWNNINYSVASIDWGAFYNCTELTGVSIPNSVTSIGAFAFNGCTNLSSISIGNSITLIDVGVFRNCSSLSSITIPNSVTEIGYEAFAGCTNLSIIIIPNSVARIGYDAFLGTAWYSNQPDGLVYAGLVAYKYKGTMPDGTNIFLKDGTLSISWSAFEDCIGLTSISIPESVTYIGQSSFQGCI